MAAEILESIMLCILLILFSKKSGKRHLIWHTDKETCLIDSLSTICKERVGREPVALDGEAAVSLGWAGAGGGREVSFNSSTLAIRQPRAEKEDQSPPSCYRGTLKGLRMADFFGCYVQPENKQIFTETPGAPPLIGEGWTQPQRTR